MTRREDRVDPYSVRCPTCRSEAYEPCLHMGISRADVLSRPHRSRWLAADDSTDVDVARRTSATTRKSP